MGKITFNVIVRMTYHQGEVTVGPRSVGYKLTYEALVFGGGKLTSTDIAIASGFCDNIGDKKRVIKIPEDVRIGALNYIKRKIEVAIDRVKVISFFLRRGGGGGGGGVGVVSCRLVFDSSTLGLWAVFHRCSNNLEVSVLCSQYTRKSFYGDL